MKVRPEVRQRRRLYLTGAWPSRFLPVAREYAVGYCRTPCARRSHIRMRAGRREPQGVWCTSCAITRPLWWALRSLHTHTSSHTHTLVDCPFPRHSWRRWVMTCSRRNPPTCPISTRPQPPRTCPSPPRPPLERRSKNLRCVVRALASRPENRSSPEKFVWCKSRRYLTDGPFIESGSAGPCLTSPLSHALQAVKLDEFGLPEAPM